MTSHTTSAPLTAAETLRRSPAIASAIDQILEELDSATASLTAVRGPVDSRGSQRLDEYLRHAAAVRGKPKLYYPYVGSGIGRGPFVELADGSVKMDFICGIGVHFFGHNEPGVVRASLLGAMGDSVMQGHLQSNREVDDFSQLLVDQAAKTSRIRHAFLTNSGCMANEAAIKICYQHNAPASRVIAFSDCFMGRSVTMCQIGDSAANREGIPLSTLVDYMPFYDPELGEESTRRAKAKLLEHIHRYPGQHACFIFELVQGEGGFNTAPREFFVELMTICRDHGIAVWADEVQTFGRTPQMFAFETYGLGEFIDVVTLGKMSQICACLYTEAYNPRPGLLSGTFIGSTVGLHAGREIVSRLADGDYYGPQGRISKHHALFRSHVEALAKKHPAWFPPVRDASGHELKKTGIVGGIGGMMRFSPFGGQKKPVSELLQVMFEEGIIGFYCGHGPYHVRFLPPLGILEESHWDAAFEVLERAMARIAEAHGFR